MCPSKISLLLHYYWMSIQTGCYSIVKFLLLFKSCRNTFVDANLLLIICQVFWIRWLHVIIGNVFASTSVFCHPYIFVIPNCDLKSSVSFPQNTTINAVYTELRANCSEMIIFISSNSAVRAHLHSAGSRWNVNRYCVRDISGEIYTLPCSSPNSSQMKNEWRFFLNEKDLQFVRQLLKR